MKFRQHLPGFVDATPYSGDYEKFEDIPSVPDMEKYPGFFRFSISDGDTLMAELHDGYEWWVVGFFENKDDVKSLNLPVWSSKYKECEDKK